MKTLLFLVGILFIVAGVVTGFVSQLDYGNALIGLNLGLAATLLVGGFIILGLSAITDAITSLIDDFPDSLPQDSRSASPRDMPFPAATAPVAVGAGAGRQAIGSQFETAADNVDSAIDKVAKAAEKAVEEARKKPEPAIKPEPAAAAKPQPAIKPEPAVATKPVPAIKPELAVTTKPVPAIKPEPAAAAKPVPAIKPEPAAAAKPEPAIKPEPAAAAKPEPVVKPEPTFETKPEPVIKSEPAAVAKAEPGDKSLDDVSTKPDKAEAKDSNRSDDNKPETQQDAVEEETPDQLYIIEELIIRGKASRLLSDNTIEAETAEGWMRFENVEHLEEYLDAMEK